MPAEKLTVARAHGRARLGRVECTPGAETVVSGLVLPGHWQFAYPLRQNLVLYDWASITAQLLRKPTDGREYHISTMYLEFENNDGDPVTPPSPSREEGLSYYTSLAGNLSRDYIRVPIIATTLDSTDASLFPSGNRLRFFAQTIGTTGVNGRPFSAGAQSRVYGGALVSTPDFSDASRDIVFSRLYHDDEDDQLAKLASSQIGQEWELILD